MTTFHPLSAAEWGMTWTRPPEPEKLNDPEGYLHHSGGSVRLVGGAGRGMLYAINYMRGLNDHAQREKNYSALDYDDVVLDLFLFGGPDEVWICEGRGRYMSAATRRRNEQGEALCAAGMFHPGYSYSVEPRPATLEGIARGFAKQIDEGRLAPDAWIGGHRDNRAFEDGQPTACPGDDLYPNMHIIRRRVNELLAGEAPELPPPPPEDDMTQIYIGRAASGPHDGHLLISLSGVMCRVVEHGADEAGVMARIDAGLATFTDIRSGQAVHNGDQIPELGGAWVVQMGTVVPRGT